MTALLASDPSIDEIIESVSIPGWFGKPKRMSRASFLAQLEKMKAGTWAQQRTTLDTINSGTACQRFVLWRFTDKGIVFTARGERVLKTLREETA